MSPSAGRDVGALRPKIVSFLAQKRSDTAIDTSQEAELLQKSLGRIYECKIHTRPTFQEFEEEMWNAGRDNVRIVHFAGHGESQGLQWLLDQKGLNTVASDIEGTAQLVGQRSLKHRGPVACVFLNACDSEALGRSMHAAGVGRVVCWQGEVPDHDAIAFASAFFRYLKHLHEERDPDAGDELCDFDKAFEEGKRAVATARKTRPGAAGGGRHPTAPAKVTAEAPKVLLFPDPRGDTASNDIIP
eukprot:1689757-Rhodomonas_salina.1